jgi:hypothetical protein
MKPLVIGAGATAAGLSILALYLLRKRYFLSLEDKSKRKLTNTIRENRRTKYLKKTEADARRFLISNNVTYNLSIFAPKGKFYCGKVDIEFFLNRKRSGKFF